MQCDEAEHAVLIKRGTIINDSPHSPVDGLLCIGIGVLRLPFIIIFKKMLAFFLEDVLYSNSGREKGRDDI
ncbi:hypothetical protein J31TS3_57980 [Paenibacillus lactis]|nr:hypothetical protein J31TS3_57980 [Paenibacillus lactis]